MQAMFPHVGEHGCVSLPLVEEAQATTSLSWADIIEDESYVLLV